MSLFRLFLILGLPAVFIRNNYAQEVWTRSIPLPTGQNLVGVVNTGTQLVAVGRDGTIITSPDGITWTHRDYGGTNSLFSIIWTGTQLVVMGNNGAIITSLDGITWTTRSSGASSNLRSIIWTGTQLVAVGDDGTILTSPDGITWTIRNLIRSNALNSITWTGTLLVAAGVDGTILTSPQGSTSNIATRSLVQSAFSFSLSHAALFISLPKAMQGRITRVVIYGITGEKVYDHPIVESQGEIVASVSSLPRGRYFLEVKGSGQIISKPFSLIR